MGDVYFEGDPAVDSSRRHMERVLKGEPTGRKWPLILTALAGGGLWALWRVAAEGARSRPTADGEPHAPMSKQPNLATPKPQNTAPR